MFFQNMKATILSAASTVSPGAMDVQDVMEQMNSDASAEEKTSFFIQYLLAQREELLNFGKTVLLALLVFFIGTKIIKFILKFIDRWMERGNVEISVHKFVLSLSRVLLYIFLLVVVAGMLGVGTSSIVAIIGSAGLAIGLALQGSLANFAGGILILVLKPFRVGDYIVSPSAEGTVQSIDIFYTHLLTFDNRTVVVPNGILSNENITNNSREEYRLLVIDFMVGYDADIQQVKSILMGLMQQENLICQERFMGVNIDKLNPGRVKMQLKAWVLNEEYWDARYRMLELIKENLQENGISLM